MATRKQRHGLPVSLLGTEGMLGEGGFVQLHPEPGTAGQRKAAILEMDWVFQQIRSNPLVRLRAGCLEDKKIGNGGGKMQIHYRGDGTIRIVWGHADVMSLGQGSNLFHSRNAATVHQIALQ